MCVIRFSTACPVWEKRKQIVKICPSRRKVSRVKRAKFCQSRFQNPGGENLFAREIFGRGEKRPEGLCKTDYNSVLIQTGKERHFTSAIGDVRATTAALSGALLALSSTCFTTSDAACAQGARPRVTSGCLAAFNVCFCPRTTLENAKGQRVDVSRNNLNRGAPRESVYRPRDKERSPPPSDHFLFLVNSFFLQVSFVRE